MIELKVPSAPKATNAHCVTRAAQCRRVATLVCSNCGSPLCENDGCFIRAKVDYLPGQPARHLCLSCGQGRETSN